MKQYIDLLKHLTDANNNFVRKDDRTGVGTAGVFGYQMRYNMQNGFPLATTKKMHFKGILVELLWFLRGGTNIKYLVDNGCHIWNKDAYRWYEYLIKKHNKGINESDILNMEDFVKIIQNNDADFVEKANTLHKIPSYKYGDLGNVYGKQWRNWKATEVKSNNADHQEMPYYIDQIANVIKKLKTNPNDRRMIVSAWNPADTEIDKAALPPCHALFHFNGRPLTHHQRTDILFKTNKELYQKLTDDKNIHTEEGWKKILDEQNIPRFALDCLMYQRSCDTILGVPYNVASYSTLLIIVAEMCGMLAGEFIWTGGDVHVYLNHEEAIAEQLTREPRPLPTLTLDGRVKTLTDPAELELSDFELTGYDPYPPIKAELNVGSEVDKTPGVLPPKDTKMLQLDALAFIESALGERNNLISVSDRPIHGKSIFETYQLDHFDSDQKEAIRKLIEQKQTNGGLGLCFCVYEGNDLIIDGKVQMYVFEVGEVNHEEAGESKG